MVKNNLRDDLLALVSRLQKQAYDNVDYSKNMAFEECDIVEYRAIGHCQEVIANKLLTILGVPTEQPIIYPTQESATMATKNTVKSLASDKTYFAFVVEGKGDEKFVMGNLDSGIMRAPTTMELPDGLELSDGLHVFQGKANGTFNAHVQYKGAAGNRPYGWSFETNDPAVRAIVA